MRWNWRLIAGSVLLSLTFSVDRGTAQSCPQLFDPIYGSMQCTGQQVNDRCEFTCDQGYELFSSSSELRRCVCTDPTNCYWTGQDASCGLIMSSCPRPVFTGTTYSLCDNAPTAVIVRVTVSPSKNSLAGWTAVIIFNSPLDSGITVNSHSVKLSAISPDRKVLTFINRRHNSDISSRQQYAFSFILEGSNMMTNYALFTALVGFYDTQVLDASCLSEPSPVVSTTSTTTLSTTLATSSSSSSTISTTSSTTSTITTTTTAAPTTTTISTTTEPSSNNVPTGCQEIQYEIDNPGWNGGEGWNFIFRYKVPTGDWNDWTIKVVFSEGVSEVNAYDSVADGPYTGGKVWLFKPKSWNTDMTNQHMDAIGMSVTSVNFAPDGIAIICNNGVEPDLSLLSTTGGSVAPTTTMSTTTTNSPVSTSTSSPAGSTASVASTPGPTLDPNGASGYLPIASSQTMLSFTPSPTGERVPYDYNEILHKSILFYEAQRSGKLPESNRIPWRGDSGLKDGCVAGSCIVDLTGGWYDAGDFVKFGFPMAWSTTVLAWGMLEFKEAYVDAGEWNNALSMLKWATDYFVKAHVSPNELYIQVGDPAADHASWGHPETMTMERPIFKIDTSNPGTEVAAETAAALAAASIIFENEDPLYAGNLRSHAIQLYEFADTYRGHYHISVPESGVENYYRSWSGYNDDLGWAAMWLYKATNDQKYLNDAVQLAGSLTIYQFSWDQKGPGALLLLSRERSEFEGELQKMKDFAENRPKTPGGQTHFSDWGSNRYAANYALIALMIAKDKGLNSPLGRDSFEYGRDQIHRMLGEGDGFRSYVVGFGTNPPERPHHRASSCRSWTSDPNSQECDWPDRDRDAPNPHTLYGALVGGPTLSGSYIDDRKSYISNEVAVDYNAGFQSAVAALKYFMVESRGS